VQGSAIRCRTNWLVQYDCELAIGKRRLYGCAQMLAWFEFRQKREIGDVTLPDCAAGIDCSYWKQRLENGHVEFFTRL
jgi:hypothetical protein